MADYTRYPQAGDVEILLRSTTFWPTNPTAQALAVELAQQAADAAAKEFEVRTGWRPFLVRKDEDGLPVASTRYFSHTTFDGLLEFSSGLLSLSSLKVDGQTIGSGEYWLVPSNAGDEEATTTGIQMTRGVGGASILHRPNRIEVTGVWGFCVACPADAWQAILRHASVNLLSQIENNQSVASISQDGFSKSLDIVGTITQKDLLSEWSKLFSKAVQNYMKVVV